MSEEPNADLHHELSRHAGALRGLARDLLRDAHAADDVTQQTLAKAWTSRRQLRPGPMRGWLQRTLTNFSRQWQRGERRRSAHEHEHARREDEHAPPTDDSLARRETLRDVTAAVLQLDEPYQTAIFLRYFEDLPPREIARRTDAPIATVKSRLARGLAMLRRRLADDGKGRDWRLALAGTFGLPLTATLVPLTATGALLMKTTMKLSAAAVAICVGGWLWYDRGATPPPPTLEGGEEPAPAQTVAEQAGGDEAADEALRVDATPRTVLEPWLAHPYELELEITVLDRLGLPVEGHQPRLAPVSGELRHAAASSDADGKLLVRFAARTPQVDVEVLDDRRHRRLVRLRHGVRTQLTLLQQPSGGNTWAISRTARLTFSTSNGTTLIRSLPTASGTTATMANGLHPHAVFSEAAIVAIEPEEEVETNLEIPDLESVFFVDAGSFQVQPPLSGVPILSSLNLAVTEEIAVDTSDAPACVLEGVVYGEDGKPAAEAPVALFGGGPQPLRRGKADAQGRYRFEKLAPGDLRVRGGGEAAGLGISDAHVDVGDNRADVHLRRDACIRGRLLDGNGAPIAGAGVDWHAADGAWADRTETDERGAFVFANLPRGPGTLTAWSSDKSRGFPIAHETGVQADTGEVLLAADTRGGSKLSVAPRAARDLDLTQLRVRVRNLDTGFSRGISVPRITREETDEDGVTTTSIETPKAPWTVEHLPAGNYAVEVWLPGAGRLDCGRHYVDGETDYVLGQVMLRAPGRVHFALPDGGRLPQGAVLEITELKDTFDVRVETMPSPDHDLWLPAGDYALAIASEDGSVRFAKFSVRSGQLTTVPIDG